MNIAIIIFSVLWVWVIYEFITAPIYDEKTGKFTPKSKSGGSYSDLEKKGRGRSKY